MGQSGCETWECTTWLGEIARGRLRDVVLPHVCWRQQYWHPVISEWCPQDDQERETHLRVANM